MAQLSFVIPVYNAEPHIGECLSSLAAQTLKDAEYILVDDGSTDGSGTICDAWAKKDSRFRIFHQQNRGCLRARLRGVREAHGQWIAFLDPDDYLPFPASAQQMLLLAEGRGDDIVMFQCEVIGGQEAQQEHMKKWLNRDAFSCSGQEIIAACYVEKRFAHNVIGKVYRGDTLRDAARQAEEFFMVFAEDYYLFFCIALSARRFSSVPGTPLYAYRWGSGVSTKKEITPAEFASDAAAGYGVVQKMKAMASARGYHEGMAKLAATLENDMAVWHCRRLDKLKTEEKPAGLRLLLDAWPAPLMAVALSKAYKNRMPVLLEAVFGMHGDDSAAIRSLKQEAEGLQAQNETFCIRAEEKEKQMRKLEKRNARLSELLQKSKARAQALRDKREKMKASLSWRIGRAMTWPFRKMRKLRRGTD